MTALDDDDDLKRERVAKWRLKNTHELSLTILQVTSTLVGLCE